MLLILLSFLPFSSFSSISIASVLDSETIQSDGSHWQASGSGLNHLCMYRFPICKRSFPRDNRKLCWHLLAVHSLSDSQDYTIFYSQNGCQRTYHNLNSSSRHLSREHLCASSLSNQTSDYTTIIIAEKDVTPDTAISI